MKKRRKILSIIMVVAMIITMMPTSVMASTSSTESGDLKSVEFQVFDINGNERTAPKIDFTNEKTEYDVEFYKLALSQSTVKVKIDGISSASGETVVAHYNTLGSREINLIPGEFTEIEGSDYNSHTQALLIDVKKDDKIVKTYKFNIKHKQCLGSIKLKDNNGVLRELDSAFVFDVLNYTAEIPKSVKSLSIVTISTDNSKVTVNNSIFGNNAEVTLDWNIDGKMIIPIKVEAENEIPTTYTIELKRVDIDYMPYFEQDLTKPRFTYMQNANATPLEVKVHTEGDGKLSYQWYKTPPAGTIMPGKAIKGETDSSFTPSTAYGTTPVGENYRCRVTYEVNGQKYVLDSKKVTVVVNATEADTPEIIKQPEGAIYIQGTKSVPLVITATRKDAGKLTYQWYQATDSTSEGKVLEEQTGSQCNVSTETAGDFYYYCVVTNTISGKKKSVESNRAKITVTDAGLSAIFKNGGDGTDKIQAGLNLNAFSGNIDGAGYTLTVQAGNKPLLGYVNDATVRNLNIFGEDINGYGLVNNYSGVNLKGSAITIDNVTIKSGTRIKKAGLIGTELSSENGFAGCSAGFVVTIKNCTSAATVRGRNYVGGIVGGLDNALNICTVRNCKFTGSVSGNENVGGIIGGGYNNASAPNGNRFRDILI